MRLPSPLERELAERDLNSWDWEKLVDLLHRFRLLKVVRFKEEEKSAPSQFRQTEQQLIRDRMNTCIRGHLSDLWELGKLRFS